MLTKLDKFKRLFSSVLFIISVLIFILVIFYVNNKTIHVIAAIVLCLHFMIAFVYFIKGISMASMCLVYYLFFCIGITLSLLLRQFIKLPFFLDKQIFNTIGIIIPIIFTVAIPLPKMVKEWIADKLDGKDKKVTSEEIIAKSFGIQERDLPGIEYDTFADYRATMKYSEAPYSIANTTESLRVIRLIVGGLFLVIGIVGLLVGTNIIDNSSTFLSSWTFRITVCSIVLFASGSTIIIAGFIRGFICIIALSVLAVLGYNSYGMLQNVLEKSIFLYYLSSVLLIAVPILCFTILIRFISKKQNQVLTIYEENNCIYAVDFFLNDVYPIIDYCHLICIKIHFNETVSLKDFDCFNDDFLLYCANKKIVFAGAILNEREHTYTLYIYFRTHRQEKKIKGYLRRINFCMEADVKNDVNWEVYKTILTPSKITLIKMYNRSILNDLEEEKFDFTNTHPVIFTAVFEEEENALKFKENVEQQSYEKVIYEDNTEYAQENNLIKKYYYQVHVQKTMRISEAWLNIETQKFYQLAKNHGGEYEFLNLGELNENS